MILADGSHLLGKIRRVSKQELVESLQKRSEILDAVSCLVDSAVQHFLSEEFRCLPEKHLDRICSNVFGFSYRSEKYFILLRRLRPPLSI